MTWLLVALVALATVVYLVAAASVESQTTLNGRAEPTPWRHPDCWNPRYAHVQIVRERCDWPPLGP